MNIDSVYIFAVVAAGKGSVSHFRFGVSADPFSRLAPLQRVAPIPIVEMLYVEVRSEDVARLAKKQMLSRWENYLGEDNWLTFDIANLKHKADFNQVTKDVLTDCLGSGWKWKQVSAKRAIELKRLEETNAANRRKAAKTEHERKLISALREGRLHPY